MKLQASNPLIFCAILAAAPLPFQAGNSIPRLPETLPSDEEIAQKISDADAQRDSSLRDYSAMRKYNLHNSHLKSDALMTVRISYRKGQGKSFEIVDLQNAEGMSRKVLQKLIDSEAETSRARSQDELDVTSANYKFHVIGSEVRDGRACYIVTLTPKRKSKYLIQGKAWVDADDFAVVRLEGRPSASLSFWVGKPYIVQEFRKVGPFWMASHNRSESQSMILGSSVLTIDYSGYEVNNPDVRIAENHGPATKRTSAE